MADNNEATALFGNMAGFCGCRGFDCLPMFPSGLSLASGFGVFETYYFALVRRPGGLFVNILAVSDGHHNHAQHPVFHRVYHAVIPFAEAVQVFNAFEFLATGRTRVIGQ